MVSGEPGSVVEALVTPRTGRHFGLLGDTPHAAPMPPPPISQPMPFLSGFWVERCWILAPFVPWEGRRRATIHAGVGAGEREVGDEGWRG